jgi:hypothetical protein
LSLPMLWQNSSEHLRMNNKLLFIDLLVINIFTDVFGDLFRAR